MNWLLLTALAVISRATYGIAVKLTSVRVKVSAHTQATLLTTGAGLLSLIFSPLLGGVHFGSLESVWGLAILMVVSYAIGNIVFFKGQETLDASTTQIAFASILLWGTLLSSIFLHSQFSFKQLIGVFVLFGAILIVQYSKTNKRRLNKGIAYIVLSAALFAVFQTTSAELAKTISAGTYMVLTNLGSSVIVATVYRKRIRADLPYLRKHSIITLKSTLFVCVTNMLYFIFAYFAYRHAPDRGVVVVLLTSQVVLAVILAIVFLKERSNVGRKLAGGILAVVAGVLIKS